MRKYINNQQGIAFLLPVLLVALTGTVITAAVLQANKVQQDKKAAQQTTQDQAKLAELRDRAKNLATPSISPQPSTVGQSATATPAPKPGTSSTPKPATATATPKSTPAATPAPTWNVVHPTSATCQHYSDVTVYISAPAGAPIYNYDAEGAFSAVVGTAPYKSSQAGKCHITGNGWVAWGGSSYPNGRFLRFQDVSLTPPPQ
jgi:hypothetical protein